MIKIKYEMLLEGNLIISDRFLSIGSPGRPFATSSPSLHDPLPSDDAAWDAGVSLIP